jgi:hypothetical protein
MFTPCGSPPRPTAPRKTRATEDRSRWPSAQEGSSGSCPSRRRTPSTTKGLANSTEKANVRRRNPRSRFVILSLHVVDETRIWGSFSPRARPSMPTSEPARPHSPCGECHPVPPYSEHRRHGRPRILGATTDERAAGPRLVWPPLSPGSRLSLLRRRGEVKRRHRDRRPFFSEVVSVRLSHPRCGGVCIDASTWASASSRRGYQPSRPERRKRGDVQRQGPSHLGVMMTWVGRMT